ncbi:MAG: fused response regulator/phosphatase [Betaproteobacteria bacterium]|nr:fused response regulator/phosphatase [Betaproteobacteria bacterium]
MSDIRDSPRADRCRGGAARDPAKRRRPACPGAIWSESPPCYLCPPQRQRPRNESAPPFDRHSGIVRGGAGGRRRRGQPGSARGAARRAGHRRHHDGGRRTEALETIARRPFDLVLLDLMMPNVNGIQVLEALREQGRLEALPVIMVSASNEMTGVVRCIELGAEDYLTKPVNGTLLRARVGATLEKKRLRDALRAKLAQMDHELLARELQLGMVPRFRGAGRHGGTHLLPSGAPGRRRPVRLLPGRGDTLWFAIGDVSGKGAAAAIFMARTWSCLRSIATRASDAPGSPGAVLTAMNRELCEANASSMFTTLFLGHLERASGRVAYANAGHLPPLHLARNGGLVQLDELPAASGRLAGHRVPHARCSLARATRCSPTATASPKR